MKPFPFAMWPLQKAPTPSGLSPEEHARLMARFPSTPSSPTTPSIPHAPSTTSSAPSDNPNTEEELQDWEHAHNAYFYDSRSVAYRQARPRTGPDDEGTMRSIAVRAPTGRQSFVTVKPLGPKQKPRQNESDPIEYELSDELQSALNSSHDANRNRRGHIQEHIENTGSINNGDMFLRLGLLHKNIVDHIADEYLKWHEGGKGPRPDLSKYENPVTRNADGTPWDWRKTAQEAYDFHSKATDYDWYHDYIRRALNLNGVGEINPHNIWRHIDTLVNAKANTRDGKYLPTNVEKAINLNELRRNGLYGYQYPDLVRALMRLAMHHKKMTELHERDSATKKSFSHGSVQKTELFPFAVWPNRDNIK
jgi:hypothetical protein